MKRLLLFVASLSLALAIWCGVSRAAGQSGWGAAAGVLQKYPFAFLPPERDGYSLLVTDGTPGTPCTGGGTGAVGVGVNGQWTCLSTGTVNAASIVLSVPPTLSGTSTAAGGVNTLTFLYTGQSCNNSTSPCTVTSGVLSGDATAGNVTFNLPVSNGTQTHIEACKIDSTANTITLHRNGTDTIIGAASDYVLSTQWQCAKLTDAKVGNWWVTHSGSVGAYKGPINMTGTSTTGADVIKSANVNGVNNVVDWGADPTGVADSALAAQAAINAACAVSGASGSQLPAVYFPTASVNYKILRPIVDECNLAANSSVPQQARLIGDGQQVSKIKAAFYGPAIISYPSQANGNTAAHGMSIVTGSVGSGAKAIQLTGIGDFDLNDLIAPLAGTATLATGTGPFNGLAQFDVRFLDVTDTDTSVTRCLWSSEGAWNTVKDYRGSTTTDVIGGSQDGLGGICIEGGTGKIEFSLKVNGVIQSIKTSTVATQGTHYEYELSYDGSNIRGYFGPAAGTISAIWTQAATGNITQRGDENDRLFGFNNSTWPSNAQAIAGISPWKGIVQSVQFSNVARHTTASYTADSANFTSDANTTLLFNFGLVAFPAASGNGTLPILQVDTVNYQTTIPGWVVAHPLGIGCCGGLFEASSLGMVPSNNTTGFDIIMTQYDIHDVIPAGSYMGIAALDAGTFNSQIHDLMVSSNANVNPYVDIAESGGALQSTRNIISNVAGWELIASGGPIDNIFFQNNAQSICPAALFGTFTAKELNDDSENGGTFPALCLRNPIQATVSLSGFGPQGAQPIIQLVGNVNNLKFDQDQFTFAGGATTVADATFAQSTLGNDSAGARFQNGVPIIFQDPYFPLATPTTDLPSGKVWTTLPYKVVHNTNLPEVVAQPQNVTTAVTNGSQTVSPVSQAQPVGLQTGMLEITQVVEGFTTAAITPPSGWTLIRSDTTADTNATSKLYFHAYAATDPASFSWSFGAVGGGNVGFFTWAVSGVDLFNPIQLSGANVANSGATSVVSPSQTSTYGDEPVLSIAYSGNNRFFDSSSGQPTNAEPIPRSIIGFYWPQLASTSVPAVTYNFTPANAPLVAQTVVFNPVSSDQNPTPITRNQVDAELRNISGTEAAAPSGVAGKDLLYPDSTSHRWKMNNNNLGVDQVGDSLLYNAAGTQLLLPHDVRDTTALTGGTVTVTLTGAAAYTSTTSYSCSCEDTTSLTACTSENLSASSVKFSAGVGTDTITFACNGT